jgi:putative transposase
MMRRLTYEYRIYPSKKQVQRLLRSFLLAQRMYNHLLERAISTYQVEGRRLTKFDMCTVVKQIKDDDPSFRSAYSQVLQNCADRLSKAFDNFFRRVKENNEGKRQKPGFPRFKTSVKSITYPQDGFKLEPDGGRLYISKIGSVKVRLHRPMEGRVKTLTIVNRRSGKWFVQFSCILEDEGRRSSDGGRPEIGIDLGVRHFITTSSGERIEAPPPTDRERRKHSRLQRKIDRKPPGSHNRTKARITFARWMERGSNRRHDFLHNVSRSLVDNYSTIAVESLNIKDMILYSTVPDEINNAAWGTLLRMLSYKAESAGTLVISVDRYDPTSQICSGCHKRRRISGRETVYHCPHCVLTIDRDINAAKNILFIAKSRARHARSDAWGEGTSTSHIFEMRAPSSNQELYARACVLAENSI